MHQANLYSVNKPKKPFDKSYRTDNDDIRNRLQTENIDFVKRNEDSPPAYNTPDFSSFLRVPSLHREVFSSSFQLKK